MYGKVWMKEQVDRRQLVHRLTWGGPSCDFFKFPDGIIKKGAILSPKEITCGDPHLCRSYNRRLIMANSVTVNGKKFETSKVHGPIEIKYTAQGGEVIVELPEGCNKAIIDARTLKKVSNFFND